MKFNKLHLEFIDNIEYQLHSILNISTTSVNLLSAMEYSTVNGGKRIRPLLTIAGGLICNCQNRDVLIQVGNAFELIHCYSLIHDDLPAMDNDDLRRGKPTCHIKFNEALAILAGDTLQSLAFETLSTEDLPLPVANKLALVNLCAHASGINGMAGGQALDLNYTGIKITIEQLQNMHELKTGKLIQASLIAGYLSSNVSNHNLYEALSQLGYKIGLLFQVVDDIIDVTSTTQKLGKTANKDQEHAKSTYVTLWGLEQAKHYARTLYDSITTQVKDLPNSNFLAYLITLIYNRDT